jgi:hypothetical protein
VQQQLQRAVPWFQAKFRTAFAEAVRADVVREEEHYGQPPWEDQEKSNEDWQSEDAQRSGELERIRPSGCLGCQSATDLYLRIEKKEDKIANRMDSKVSREEEGLRSL